MNSITFQKKQLSKDGQMSEDKFVENFYDTTAYTADISTKMRIPEHINAHGSYANGDPYSGKEFGKQNSALYDMQVPDRWETSLKKKIFKSLNIQE